MNELEKRAQAHSKKKDGLSPFCSLSEDSDYYKYITDIKTADNGAESNEEDTATFVKRVTSGDDLVQYVADRIDIVDNKHYLIGYKSDMQEIRFLLGTPGESSSYYNVRHLLKSPYWHISLSLKDELTELYLSKKVDEAKKKKKPFDSINTNAGNVEHNIAMFNKMNSPIEGPCTNPVSGPFGGDVGGGEAMGEAFEGSDTWVLIKTDKWYDPEGLGIEPKGKVICSGTEEECREAFSDIVVDARKKDKLYREQAAKGHHRPFMMIEKLDKYSLIISYPNAQSKDVYQLVKKNSDFVTEDTEGKRYPLYVYKALEETVAGMTQIPEEHKERFITLVGDRCEEKRIPRVGWKSAKLPAAIIRKYDLRMYGTDNYRWFCRFNGEKNGIGLTLEEALVEIYNVMKDKWFNEVTEAMTPQKKETIELEYKDLEFTQYGPQRDVDDWDEWGRCMDWTYEVDKDDLYTFIFESCIDESDFPEAFEDDFDPNDAEHWARFETWLDDNFDAIYSKYEEKILENWEEDAAEEASEEYDPDDYVDWDSMPGGHDDDRYWEDLNEGEEVFMEKYSFGLNEEYEREPKMIDYFEQMNSEEDEA